MEKNNINKLVYAGLMMALVFIATGVIPHIPIPFTQGYVHIGDSMIFVTAIFFGWKYGAVVGGIGSALADVFLSYTMWALPTLLIKSLMGAVVGFMAHPTDRVSVKAVKNVFSLIIGGGWLMLGIYLNYLLTNVSGSNIANQLVQQLNLNNLDELKRLVSTVKITLLAASVLIPMLVITLSIIFNKKDKQLFSISTMMGMTLGGLVMVIGYYLAEYLMVGNAIVPIFSIPFSLMQFVAGVIVAYAVIIPLKKIKYFQGQW